MELPVLIEPISENCFRASSGALALSVEAPTQDEAFARLETLVRERVAGGLRVAEIKIPTEDSWLSIAGIFENDPSFEDWQEEIRKYRREVDEDPNHL